MVRRKAEEKQKKTKLQHNSLHELKELYKALDAFIQHKDGEKEWTSIVQLQSKD